MNNPFTFNAYDIGQPTQHILFSEQGQSDVRYDIPDMAIPTNQEEKFWALYNKLIELGAIPDRTPVYNG